MSRSTFSPSYGARRLKSAEWTRARQFLHLRVRMRLAPTRGERASIETDDIVRGMEPGTLSNLAGVLIFVAWLYGTLVLGEWRSGYVINLVGSLLGMAVSVLHMKGAGVGGEIAKSSGAFFVVWTLLALGATATFSFILSIRGIVHEERHSRRTK